MQLGQAPSTLADPTPDRAIDWLRRGAWGELDDRLIRDDPAPVAVAFSGGGDSLALLIAAHGWAQARGRPLLALTVDHRLRPQSGAWAHWCADRAKALGVRHQTLVWDAPCAAGDSGVSARARRARHALLADAAREAGAAAILIGHTADDIAEAEAMRAAGSTTPSPRAWSPSPAWPEGRGLFLLRPLLGLRRAALREALTALGESWIEDPGNVDPASARARARAMLSGVAAGGAAPATSAAIPIDEIAEGPAGDLTSPRAPLSLSPSLEGRRVLGAMAVCAGGADRLPRRQSVDRLLARIAAGETFAATLAGARVAATRDQVLIVRDAAARGAEPVPCVALPAGRAMVFDGRFEIQAREPGARAMRLAGHAAALDPARREALASASATLPPAARRALPLVRHADGDLSLPTLVPDARVAIIPLVKLRLVVALGAIEDETAARRLAKPSNAPKWNREGR